MRKHTFTRKLLPMALAAAMALPAVPAMAATNDIEGHWAEQVLTEWQEKGLLKGYADGSVKPNNSITRAEFITLINNAKNITEEKNISFTDVKPSDWFYSAVAKAAAYAKGYADGTFRPNQTITRAEAAVMLANVAGLSPNEEGADDFSDAIPAWAKGSIGAVVAAGLMSGYPDGSFGANTPTTRAESVSALDRAINSKADTNAPEPTEEIKQPTEEIKQPTEEEKPAADSSSSGGSSSRRKNNIALKQEVTGLQVPYAITQADVEKSLPKTVTLLDNDGNETQAEITWALQGTWQNQPESGKTCENTFIGTINVPDGYRYNGAMTTKTTVTVVAEGETPETKKIDGHYDPDSIEISYAGTKELVLAEAKNKLITEIELNCEDDSRIVVPIAKDTWRFTYSDYNPSSHTDQTVSLVADALLPTGYSSNGKNTVDIYCGVEVKKLDTAALQAATDTAKATLDTLVDSEDVALADKTKIYVVRDNTTADDVTYGVRFIPQSQKTALKDAYDTAYIKMVSDTILSQAEADTMAQELQAKAAALTPQTGKYYSNQLIAQNIENWLNNSQENESDSSYAYNTHAQPLKPKSNSGEVYSLPDHAANIQIDADGKTADIPLKWEVSDNNYLSVGSDNSITVANSPTEPKEVTFTATAEYNGKSLGKVCSYTATIGAPISLGGAETTPPRIASEFINPATIFIDLNGADQIESVVTNHITATGDTSGEIATNVYGIQNYTINTNNNKKLSLTIPVQTGTMGAVLAPPDPNGQDPAHAVGYVHVAIHPVALQLKEGSGWYAPNKVLTYTADIWVCNPILSVNTQMTTDGDKTKRNITITAKYVGDVAVEVAYTKTQKEPSQNPQNDSNVWKWVQIPADRATPGSDGEKNYSVYNVDGFGEPGTYYIWCRIANSTWVDTHSSFPVDSPSTEDTE